MTWSEKIAEIRGRITSWKEYSTVADTLKLALEAPLLVERISELEDALRFYASNDTYLLVETEKTRTIGILEREPGGKARAVLAKDVDSTSPNPKLPARR